MGRYLIDNNVISSYFSNTLSEKGLEFISNVIDQIPNLSVITKIEALSWINSDKGKEAIVKAFVDDSHILPLNSEIVDRCIKIRRGRKIRTPDAIIAATAIVNDCTLITSDGDFNGIPELRIIDPKKI